MVPKPIFQAAEGCLLPSLLQIPAQSVPIAIAKIACRVM